MELANQAIVQANIQAMRQAHAGNLLSGYSSLQAACTSLQSLPPSQLHVLTYNNLACLSRTRQDPQLALSYLSKALEVAARLPTGQLEVAHTHLNLAAVLAQLQRHAEALNHSIIARNTLQPLLSSTPQIASSVVVAFHSAGLAYEALHQIDDAIKSYQHAMEIALEQLGRKHILTKTIREAHLGALERYKIKHSKKQNFSVSPVSTKAGIPLDLPSIKENVRRKRGSMFNEVSSMKTGSVKSSQSKYNFTFDERIGSVKTTVSQYKPLDSNRSVYEKGIASKLDTIKKQLGVIHSEVCGLQKHHKELIYTKIKRMQLKKYWKLLAAGIAKSRREKKQAAARILRAIRKFKREKGRLRVQTIANFTIDTKSARREAAAVTIQRNARRMIVKKLFHSIREGAALALSDSPTL